MASDMNKCTSKYLSLSSPVTRLVFFSNAEHPSFKNSGLLRSRCAYKDQLRSIIFVPWVLLNNLHGGKR